MPHLGKLGIRGSEILLTVIRQRNEEKKFYAMIGIQFITDPAVVEVVIQAIKQGDEDTKSTLLPQLQRLGGKHVVSTRIAHLQEPWIELASKGLGALQAQEATADLRAVINHGNSQVQAAVVSALFQIGTPDAIAAALQHLDKHPDLLCHTIRISPSLHTLPFAEWLYKHRDALYTDQWLSALLKLVREVAVLTGDADRSLSSETISRHILPLVYHKEVYARLEKFLNDPDDKNRAFACELLGYLGVQDSLLLLRRALQDKESSVQSAAVAALGRLGDSKSIPILAKRLTEVAQHVHKRIRRYEPLTAELYADALRRIGTTEALEHLIQILQEAQLDDVRSAAVWAPGVSENQTALRPLLEALRAGRVTKTTCRALNRLASHFDPQVFCQQVLATLEEVHVPPNGLYYLYEALAQLAPKLRQMADSGWVERRRPLRRLTEDIATT